MFLEKYCVEAAPVEEFEVGDVEVEDVDDSEDDVEVDRCCCCRLVVLLSDGEVCIKLALACCVIAYKL
jgi:hypothetical protein